MKIQSVTDANNVTSTTVVSDSAVEASSDFSEQLQQELKKTTSLDKIFAQAAKSYGVDEELLKAMAKAESGFDPNATSHCGAMGIMQLMPMTAKELGVTDAYDPEQNIMGGAKYIASLLEKYDGNVSYALAAYNAGSGNVDKYGGIPPFEETQNYVAKILGYLQDGEVKIPEQWSTVKNDSTVAEEETLTDALKQLFTREDYEDFLRLFLERLAMRLEERKEEQDGQTQSVTKETTSDSDAYVAFRNFGNTNRMTVYLKPDTTV